MDHTLAVQFFNLIQDLLFVRMVELRDIGRPEICRVEVIKPLRRAEAYSETNTGFFFTERPAASARQPYGGVTMRKNFTHLLQREDLPEVHRFHFPYVGSPNL